MFIKKKAVVSVDSIVAVFHDMITSLEDLTMKLHSKQEQLKIDLQATSTEKAKAEVVINKLKDIVQ